MDGLVAMDPFSGGFRLMPKRCHRAASSADSDNMPYAPKMSTGAGNLRYRAVYSFNDFPHFAQRRKMNLDKG